MYGIMLGYSARGPDFLSVPKVGRGDEGSGGKTKFEGETTSKDVYKRQEHLSTAALLDVLGTLTTREELVEDCNKIVANRE